MAEVNDSSEMVNPKIESSVRVDPLVSIMVPVYNVERYLEACLSDLRNQTLGSLEVICVNDGSTDGSIEILQRVSALDDRIKVISQSNKGYGAALNEALRVATGKYVGIVEPDDRVKPDMFESLLNVIERHGCDVVKSNRIDFTEKSEHFIEMHSPEECGRVFRPLDDPSFFFKAPSTWTGLYRKDFLVSHAICYNETPGASYQDTGFAFEVGVFAERMVLIHDAYYLYRRDNENSSVNSLRKVFAINEEYRLLRERLIRQEVWSGVSELFCACMNQSYMWTLNRVDWLYRYAFLLQMRRDFLALEDEGALTSRYFSGDKWRELGEIMADPEAYFEAHKKECSYIARIETLERDNRLLSEAKDRANEKVEALKSSNSYKVGRALTLLPRKIKRYARAHGRSH